jgi:hypothetical protein
MLYRHGERIIAGGVELRYVGLAREQAALFALMFAALVALLKPAAANCAGVAIETLLT